MKPALVEITWSDEDLAYQAFSPSAPEVRAMGESPQQARSRLERLLAGRGGGQIGGAPPEAPVATGGSGAGGTGGGLVSLREKSPVPGTAADAPEKPSPRTLRLTRLEAASKQLDAAIRLHWEGGEPLAVHALVTAAGEVFADRLARWNGQAEADVLPRENYLRLLRRARELLRTAGGEEALEADTGRNEALIAQAIADRLSACPSRPLSADMATYRDWYRVTRAPDWQPEGAPSEPPRSRRRSRPPAAETACQYSLLP